MGLRVQKFGGTSLATAERIHRAARRAIRARREGLDVVMVVSAIGGTTDKLVALAQEISPRPPRREMDMLLTTGEQVSIALMAMAIDTAGLQAISLTGGQLGLVTDSVHTHARIQRISKDRICRELTAGNIVIVAGFQGIDENGEITTLGRGASDTTATALAAVLGADICEIYTDVDGVYTSDPRLVPQARKLDYVGYDEMLELAGAGAKVMHSRAIEFAKKHSVPVHVRSSLTDVPGTMIMAETPGMEDVVVRGVTLKENLVMVVMIGVPNTPGTAASIFAEVARHNIVVDDIIQNIYGNGKIANIGFSTDEHEADRARELCETMARERGYGHVELDEDVCKVSVVGIGMRTHSGVAYRVFNVLADARINIHSISTSEIVISCIIDAEDGPRALQLLHDGFDLDKAPAEA